MKGDNWEGAKDMLWGGGELFGGYYAGRFVSWLRSAYTATSKATPIVQFSMKAATTSRSGEKVFSYQARFPKINLNIRIDRAFRAPFHNVKAPYLGKQYNGFNTHLNIQGTGQGTNFNYHIPLNPMKWKYYTIP